MGRITNPADRQVLTLDADPTDGTNTRFWLQTGGSSAGTDYTPAAAGEFVLYPYVFDSPTDIDALAVAVTTLEAGTTYTPCVYQFVDDGVTLERVDDCAALDTTGTGVKVGAITELTLFGLVFIGGLKLGGTNALVMQPAGAINCARYLPNYGTALTPAATDDTMGGLKMASLASVPATIDLRDTDASWTLDAAAAPQVWARVATF